MAYRTHKRIARKGQEGVTLLLTLMIMAALSAIVFSISAIALNEVHTADNEAASEPAITAAEGAAEEQLFLDERQVDTSCNTTGTEQFTASGTKATYVNSYYYVGTYDFGIAPSGEQDFYLYNPCSQSTPPGYTSVTVQLQTGAGASATVDLCSWTNTTCSAAPDGPSETMAPGDSVTIPTDQGTNYIIAIVYGPASTAGNFGIQTTSNNASVTGVPAPEVTIITTGSKAGTTRKLQTQLPQ